MEENSLDWLADLAPPQRRDGAAKAAPETNLTGTNPVITVAGGTRHISAEEGIAALVAAKTPFYQRDRRIQRVAIVAAKDSDGHDLSVPGIVTVDQAMLGRELGCVATWRRFDLRTKKHVRIDPPGAVCTQILAMVGEWPFSPLPGIIQCPTLRRDGSLLDQEGYDEATGLMLVDPIQVPPIPRQPTKIDADAALGVLLGVLHEFPFVDADSKAVALSMILTTVCRGAFSVAPMHLVSAPLAGSGKSFLADCASTIATGEVCPVKAQAPSYEETEKRLVGSALVGHPIIAVDNCRSLIEGDFFYQIVEHPLLSLRALGKSDPHQIPNTFTIFSNGNNAAVAEDMVRRTVRCALDANMEHPEDRQFKSNPLDKIRRDRGKYVAAALTIPLAYIGAGRPDAKRPLLPSFQGWCSVVRDPLVWLGGGDPVATQAMLRIADPHKAELAEVFGVWKSEIGLGHARASVTAELIDFAETRAPKLRDVFMKIAVKRFDQKIDPVLLGKWLLKHEGNIAAGCKLLVDRDTNKLRPRWYLTLVT